MTRWCRFWRHGARPSRAWSFTSRGRIISSITEGEGDSDAAFVPGEPTRIAENNIEKTAQYLARLHPALDVVWLGPFAEARVDLSNPQNYAPGRLRFNPVALAHFETLEQRLKAEAQPPSTYRYVSLLDALGFDRDALVQQGCLTFRDVDHFSPCGERLFGPTIAATLNDASMLRDVRFPEYSGE